MKPWYRIGVCCAAALAAAAMPAGARETGEPREELPLQDVRIPLTQYEDGTIRTQLRAEGARVPEEGEIWARVVRLEFFDPEGKLESVVEAEDCHYDRKAQWAHSRSRVRIQRGAVTITGRGFDWDAKEERVRIRRDTRVVYRHEPGKGGRALPWGSSSSR
jgi:hypothetical protein